MNTVFGRAAVALAGVLLCTAAVAQAQPTPAPSPSASANPFTFRGQVRGFYFTRQNASNSLQGGANKAVNQATFNLGTSLHGDYRLAPQWSVGATYFYANPLSGCTSAKSHLSPPCGKVSAPALNPDDTIPGFEMSTLDEAYLQYKDPQFYGKLGDQVINLAWAPASDTRLKPSAFQGVDLMDTINSNWQLEATRMIEFENRTSSDFSKSTLLTSFPAGAAGVEPWIYVPGGTFLATNGFYYGRLGYTGANKATANLSYYGFQDISNMLWLDAKIPLGGSMKPFIAGHFLSERSTGAAVIGKIDSTVFGLQGAVSVARNVTFTLGFDTAPVHTDTVTLPAGYSCSAGTIKGTANSAKGVSLPYFLPTGGTADCSPAAGGKTNLYYGGIASPYSDSYTSDPLYTTSLTQGLVERRSPGTAWKGILTFTSDDKRLVAFISRGQYDYNNPGYAQGTYENDFDMTYYFKKLPKTGTYKGLMFRYRYGERTQSGNANIGGSPLFKNNRFQTEYDF